MSIKLLSLFCIATLFSCGSSSNANSESWQEHQTCKKVIDHYNETGSAEKRTAAEFLFSHIEGHYSYRGQYFNKYDSFFNLLDRYNKSGISKRIDRTSNKLLPELEQQWNHTLAGISRNDYASIFKQADIGSLPAEYFIRYIDNAFDAWKNNTWSQHVTFDQFCNYILPYKVFEEKPENWQSPLQTKYSWVQQAFSGATDPVKVADSVNKDIEKWFKFSELFYKYPFDMGYTRLMQGQVGGCSHMVTMVTYALRSQGIPCAVDFAPNYGNRSLGHTWNVVFNEKMEAIPFNGASTEWLEMGYVFHKQALDVKIPKVMRKTYAAQSNDLLSLVDKNEIPSDLADVYRTDVTAEYMPVSDISVQNNRADQQVMYLCIFNNRTWVPVAWSSTAGGRATFTDMGRDIAYLPAYYIDKKIVPAGNPLILHKDGRLEEVKQYKGRAQSAKLFHKYPPALTAENDTTNAVLPGDQYELFYWNEGWVSLGVKTTEDRQADIDSLGFDYKKTLFFADVDNREFLFYENVPVGTLFLLHNHTRGKEERIFMLEDSQQVWW